MDELVIFGLISDESPDTYVVNLENGMFIISSAGRYCEFSVGPDLPAGTKYNLVYFRQVRREFSQDLNETGCFIKFHIGWQAVVDGQTYQQTIAIS